MKIERLMEIVVYLLNHETATARELAERFGVSLRTIQRDMDTLGMAGVPICANTGCKGGYAIMPDYKIHNQFVSKADFDIILMALHSLRSGYENPKVAGIMEKYRAVGQGQTDGDIILDYSVLKEDRTVQENLKMLELSLRQSRRITFRYQDVDGRITDRRAEPMALKYKWYAWYLFAWDIDKAAMRTFKVIRMQNLAMTDGTFEQPRNKEAILEKMEREYLDTCIDIVLWCHRDALIPAMEFFPDVKKETGPDGHYRLYLRIPPRERMWQAFILSLGDGIKVLSPKSYRDGLIDTAKKFLLNYDIEMS